MFREYKVEIKTSDGSYGPRDILCGNDLARAMQIVADPVGWVPGYWHAGGQEKLQLTVTIYEREISNWEVAKVDVNREEVVRKMERNRNFNQ